MDTIKQFVNDESGMRTDESGMEILEYALIAGLIAIVTLLLKEPVVTM